MKTRAPTLRTLHLKKMSWLDRFKLKIAGAGYFEKIRAWISIVFICVAAIAFTAGMVQLLLWIAPIK